MRESQRIETPRPPVQVVDHGAIDGGRRSSITMIHRNCMKNQEIIP